MKKLLNILFFLPLFALAQGPGTSNDVDVTGASVNFVAKNVYVFALYFLPLKEKI